MRRVLRFACPLLGLSLLALSAKASAANPEESARADALFKEGLRLFDGGQTAKACAKFADSYKLDPALGTLQNLALCHEKEGRLAEAYGELTELQTKAQAAGKTQRVDVAREHLTSLDPKVPRAVLSFGEGVQVTGVEIDGAARDWHAPIALDPGHHVITAHAEGRPDARVEYDASGGGAQTVPVVFTGGAAATAPPPPAPSPAPLSSAPASTPSGAGPSKVLVFGLAGVGAAGIVVGSVFGVMTFSQKSAGDKHCSGSYCDASGLSSENSAHTSATVSTIGFAVGLVALAVDAVVILTSRKAGEAGAAPPASGGMPGVVAVSF
jgi:hypothetical protein